VRPDFFICRNIQFDVYSLIEKEADKLFENDEYEEAKNKYLEIFLYKQNEILKQR